ncbi:MAG: EAL domain-containing protein [Candidatus Competibacter sp.]|nr:EAL domain-containing protein [Candidatus Competibacter sp.]MDG4606115.1 EAL domain-containing protein [Candidatus Contendobacter sp.]HRD49637.1 EAL domain-containing protein [Candidatus Contendobacter sp.]
MWPSKGAARIWPLRRWLALRFALVGALPLMVVAVLAWRVLAPQLHTDLEQHHQALARAVAGQVETYLLGAQRQLDAVAGLVRNLGYRPAPYWFGLLDAHISTGPAFEAIYLVDAADAVHSVGLPESQRSRREDLIGLDLSQRDFLRQARAHNTAIWSETFLSAVTGRLAVALAVPVSEQLIIGEIAIEPLSAFINRLPDESGLFTLLDRHSQIIADSRQVLGGQQLNLSHLPIVSDALRGRFAIHSFDFGGETVIGTAVEVPMTGWIVLVTQPHRQAFQQIIVTLWVMAVGVGIALLLAMGAGWALARDFSWRFDCYTDLAHAVASGDYDRSWPSSRIAEFADLASDLQQMSLAIRQREQALVASETRFRDLSAMASDWFWEQDEQFRFTYFSSGLAQNRTILPGILGKTRWDLTTNLTPEQWAAHRAVLEARQPFREFEYCYIGPNGERWININGQPMFDEAGRFTGYRGTGRDVTEYRKADQALRQSEEKFANIFLTTPDVVVISRARDGLLLEVNPGFEAVTGYRRVDAVGRTTLELQLWADLAERERLISDLRLYGQVLYRHFTFRRNDGALRTGLFSARPITVNEESCLLFVMQDITERQRAEEALRVSEMRYRSLFERANDAIFVVDKRTGRYLDANRAAERLTGRSRAEIITLSITDLTLHDAPKRLIQVVEATETLPLGEVVYLQPDGTERIARLSTVPVSDVIVFGMAHDITEIKVAEQRIEHLAYYDALTDLPNRALLNQRAELALALAARHRTGLAVLFLDLDHFKDVNDSLGHAEGDALLIQVAARLQEMTRETDTVCRLGGDEFVLLLPDADQESALQVADKVLTALRQPFPLAGHHLRVTASIGIALYPHDGQNVNDLLKNADAALYQAKQDGRNTRVFYAREMNVATFERLVLESELRKAIAAGQLRAYYQIKVRLSDGQSVGAEALVRWLHPDHGLIPPGRFVPLAEASDLIVELGDWMLAEICGQLAKWRDAGLPPRTIAVNLAARHFRDAGLAARIQSLLAAYQLPPQALELELTESSLLEAGPQTAETLLALERLGVGLAIDDFGTGYSSLSYLKRLPITALKIDQSFVRDLVTDPDDRILAATIVALGHSLGLKVVAEGVETDEQRRILLSQGCDLAQGYFFGQPVPAEEFGAGPQRFL